MSNSGTISLLRPVASPVVPPLPGGAPNEADLGLASIIRAIAPGQHGRFVAQMLGELPSDPATIAYRQAVLRDLVNDTKLAAALQATMPQLRALAEAGQPSRWGDEPPLLQVATRLSELETYIAAVASLADALTVPALTLHSDGLRALRDRVVAVQAEPDFLRLAEEIPALRAVLDQAGSVTIGINLDSQLQPDSATIVSVNPHRFSGKGTLIGRLLGDRNSSNTVRGAGDQYRASAAPGRTPEHELFRELNAMLERVAAPVLSALDTYRRVSGRWLGVLEGELAFYLGAVRLFERVQAAGYTLCWPTIAPIDEQRCAITQCFSLDLLLRSIAATPDGQPHIVRNDIDFGKHNRIAVVTGPNSGGKTTYARMVAQAQVLFQAGLMVPGTSAQISPVRGVFSHFAVAERQEIGGGRLAEELERLDRIFDHADRTSLIILNEPFASTDHVAGRALANDVSMGLRMLGARVVFVTHLYELVEDLQRASSEGVQSLVAQATSTSANGSSHVQPTYMIMPGQPQPLAYAQELARHYGLSRTQLTERVKNKHP